MDSVVTEPAGTLAEILATYGPWGVCAILFVGIGLLYWHLSKKLDAQQALFDKRVTVMDQQYSDLLERRHEQFVDVLQECSTALAEAAETNREMSRSCRDFQERVRNESAQNQAANAEVLRSNNDALARVHVVLDRVLDKLNRGG